MLIWEDYLDSFVGNWRVEASRLTKEESKVLRREETLLNPCQIEIIEFSNPYVLVLAFFFDKSKPDLATSCRHENWKNLSRLVEELRDKYADLELDTARFHTMLNSFRSNDPESSFSIDGFKNVMGLCFPFDVRSSTPAKHLWHKTEPKEVGASIFHLNLSQAIDAGCL